MSLETEEASSGGFSSAEDNNVSGYKAIHWLAVVSLLLGLFSLLALATSFLWFTPAIAVGASIVAIVLTGPKQDRYSGRSLAIAGLVLGAFAMACAPMARLSRQQALYSAGAEYSKNWLRLVLEGKDQVAHQYSLESSERQLNEDLAELYKPINYDEIVEQTGTRPPIDPYSAMTDLLSSDAVTDLKACGPDAQIELLENRGTEYVPSRGSDAVIQVFRVTPKSGGDPVDVRVEIERKYHPEVKKGLWRTIRIAGADEV